MKALKDLSQSKKAIVYVITAAVMAAVLFSGVEPAAAESFLDKLYKLAMAYLGGQGLADLGRYAGEAWSTGKAAVESRDPDREVSLDRAIEAAGDVAKKAEDVADAIEERGE